MSPSFIDRALPSASLMLTVKLDGAPAVHLVYDHTRPFQETAVTVLDQSRSGPAWSFEDVVWQALAFLFDYWLDRRKWPAELRSPCAGREHRDAC
ncbi:MAG TPA: hypothetical protein VKF37_02545 [Chloroflexota bacterium]|nr:hypothetical protein [Chloroflexota bacterium]